MMESLSLLTTKFDSRCFMDFLQVQNISKRYSGSVYALKDVRFSVAKGQLLAICGENGAGKSTLMKILAGVIQPNGGSLFMEGKEVEIPTPQDAFSLGIRTVYQELSLDPNLSVTENMLMGRLPTKRVSWWIDWDKAHNLAHAILDDLGFSGIDVRAQTGSYSVSYQQMIEIAKAVVERPRVLILDEPSAVLSANELKHLFRLIEKLKQDGTTILYISHRLEEIFEIADKITVLKDGRSVGDANPRDMSTDDLISMMVGRPLSTIYPQIQKPLEQVQITVKGLSMDSVFEDISFSIKKGEIVGFFGLVGSGRSELARVIFGADELTSGEIYFEGERVAITSPDRAVAMKIGLVTEERKVDGLALTCSILENASLATMHQVSRNSILDVARQREVVSAKVNEMSIKPKDVRRTVGELSGGNQQKVVLAKWLLLQDLKLLILDEPTRGVDIGTKVEIYNLIADLASAGVATMMISSELPEILGMSHRVVVMREGSIEGIFEGPNCTEEILLTCAAGVSNGNGKNSAPAAQKKTAEAVCGIADEVAKRVTA